MVARGAISDLKQANLICANLGGASLNGTILNDTRRACPGAGAIRALLAARRPFGTLDKRGDQH
jgi:hypothetical protein